MLTLKEFTAVANHSERVRFASTSSTVCSYGSTATMLAAKSKLVFSCKTVRKWTVKALGKVERPLA